MINIVQQCVTVTDDDRCIAVAALTMDTGYVWPADGVPAPPTLSTWHEQFIFACMAQWKLTGGPTRSSPRPLFHRVCKIFGLAICIGLRQNESCDNWRLHDNEGGNTIFWWIKIFNYLTDKMSQHTQCTPDHVRNNTQLYTIQLHAAG